MKKGMMAITMFVALSFLVSISAVSTSFSKPPVQAVPKSQQQPPTVQMKEQVAQVKFWDLEVDRIVVKGQVIKKGGGNHTINVKVGETVTFHCYYKMKTIPVSDITLADTKYWGSGNLQFAIRLQVHSTKLEIEDKNFYKDRTLPHFTWEDVKKWQKITRSPGSKTWNEEVSFLWTPGVEYVGNMYISVVYNLDYNHTIKEPNEQNNHINTAGGLLYFVVTP